jgi:hypothetical protein
MFLQRLLPGHQGTFRIMYSFYRRLMDLDNSFKKDWKQRLRKSVVRTLTLNNSLRRGLPLEKTHTL